MQINPLDEAVAGYCNTYTKSESQSLIDLKKDTYAAAHGSLMLSEKQTAKLLQFCVYMSRAKYVLDVGTYTGYSALAIAEALNDDGIVYTLDRTTQPSIEIATKHFEKSDHHHKIKLVLGGAHQTIPELDVVFDMAFIDADKMSSDAYYELVLPKVRKGGLILVDDCLWRTQVMNPETDKRAKAMHQLNHKIVHDERVDNLILPIRHGINLIRKL